MEVILLLLDSGMRVSELCDLHIGDVDRGSGKLIVTGKGNKQRDVYMGTTARRALWRYLEADRRDVDDPEPLFISIGGHAIGGGLTPHGVHQMIADCGKKARIMNVRCSPHSSATWSWRKWTWRRPTVAPAPQTGCGCGDGKAGAGVTSPVPCH